MSKPPLCHFDILVDDIPDAKAFYEEVFGWEISTPDGTSPVEIITDPPCPASPDHPNGKIHTLGLDGSNLPYFICSFQVADIDVTRAKIFASGGVVVHQSTYSDGAPFLIATRQKGTSEFFGAHQAVTT